MIGPFKSRKVGGVGTAPSEQAAVPDRVARYAKRLGLGAARASSASEGGLQRCDFARGRIRYVEATGRIAAVEVDGERMPLTIAKTAVRLKLGSYKRSVAAAGSRFWEFTHGTARWSDVENKLSSVKAKNLWLPAPVVSAAVKARLGAFKREHGPEAKTRYEFDNGAVIAQRRSGKVLDVEA